jgi:hypothetical protein
MTITPEIPATAVPCVQCGYDLRATAATARCPECGMAAAATLAHQRGELFPPRRVRWLVGAYLCWTLGLLLLVISYLVNMLLPQNAFDQLDDNVIKSLLLVLILGPYLLLIAGNSLLAYPLSAPDPNRKPSKLLSTLRAAPLLFFVILIPLVPIMNGMLEVQSLNPDFSHQLISNIMVHTPLLIMLVSYLLLIAWRQRDLARTAPALQPTPRQRLLFRHSLITIVLLAIAYMFILNPETQDPFPLHLLAAFNAANLLLLGILAGYQFRRTYAFYRHCKTLWTSSQAPKPEAHP